MAGVPCTTCKFGTVWKKKKKKPGMQKTRYFPGSVDEECDLSLQGERNFPLLSSNSNCGQSAESKEEERL